MKQCIQRYTAWVMRSVDTAGKRAYINNELLSNRTKTFLWQASHQLLQEYSTVGSYQEVHSDSIVLLQLFRTVTL